jgi:regulator of protease activity HflC (stomatin/prohibitin superfamily)
MFGMKFIKFDSMTYVVHFKHGKIKREGRGLSFFYYSPRSSISAIPLGSRDIPFIFNETTRDFQTVSIQGQVTYQIQNPKQLAELLDFTLDKNHRYKEDNFEKLNQRLNNEAQTSTSTFIQGLDLKETIRSAKEIEQKIQDGLQESRAVKLLGVAILSVSVLGVTPTPEMARALETETREALQKEADLAIYERRNFSVEQERIIKESELNTEIAVQEKRKQIQEKQAEIKIREEENNRKLREMRMDADISVETQREKLIDLKVENDKKDAEAQGYVLEKTLKPYQAIDWKTLMAIQPGSLDAREHIAVAFRELAEKAHKINHLNITPDLLETLMQKRENTTARETQKPVNREGK